MTSMKQFCEDGLTILSPREDTYYNLAERNNPAIQELIPILQNISKMSYREEAIKEAAEELVKKSATNLKILITKQEKFAPQEQEAMRLIGELQEVVQKYRSTYTLDTEKTKRILMRLRELLKDDDRVTEAFKVISQDLERVLADLKKK